MSGTENQQSNLMVPAHVANDRPIDGAPAVLWHKTNGRLTKDDIAQTICDDKDNPIGIYMGVWAPDWAWSCKNLRTYAAITDARNKNGDRIIESFNGCASFLNKRQFHENPYENGEILENRLFNPRHLTYEMAMQGRILALKPGEFTGQMIPTDELLDRMYNLRHTGDFTKADNGGFDSRFVIESTPAVSKHWYVSSTENLKAKDDRREPPVCGRYFTKRFIDFGFRRINSWSLRSFVVELPEP